MVTCLHFARCALQANRYLWFGRCTFDTHDLKDCSDWEEFLTGKYELEMCLHGGIVSSNTVFEKTKEYCHVYDVVILDF